MKSNSMLTLFSNYTPDYDRSAPLVLSVLIHGITFVAIFLALIRVPRIVTPPRQDQSRIRYLNIDRLEFQIRRSSARMAQHDEPADNHRDAAVTKQLSAYLHPTPDTLTTKLSPQTLRQADLASRTNATVELPLPQVVIWKSHPISANSIVAPLPETSHATNATPSILLPNDESPLGTLPVAATNWPTNRNQSLPASTTPLADERAAVVQKPPITVSQTTNRPTPVAIMSLSDFLAAEGTIVLPPVNESSGAVEHEGIPTVQAGMRSQTGIEPNGNANRKSPLDANGLEDVRSDHRAMTSSYEDNSTFGSEHNSATLITLPQSGQFASVVVGTSPDDRFPEIERRWSGRLIYTVYLHVGLAHSWILQYSLPRSTEALAGGRVIRLEAPWAYSMIVDFASVDADALILNGLITQDGQFEKLSLISPQSFPQSEFVIHCLQRWKFRPATQDGHSVPAEVMLIIPTSYAD